MIQITNAVGSAKVKIHGQIGESWFSEGITLQSVLDQMNGDFSNIELEINSLGGDLLEALAIYDSLRNSNAKVSAKIIGSTASAGTIIAMGADDIEISENSNFLVHRAQTMAAGTADEMSKAALDLIGFDDQLLNIYQKRTGKSKAELSNLLKEDRWMKPAEAIEWGFVNRIIKNQNPILNIVNMDTTKLMELLGVGTEEEIQAAIEALIAKNKELQDAADALAAEEGAAQQVAIENYIDQKVTDGFIKAELKQTYLNMAVVDFDGVKAIIEAVKPTPLKNIVVPAKVEPMTKDEALKIWNSHKTKARWAAENNDEYMKIRNIVKGE